METEIFQYIRKKSLCGRIKYPIYDALEIFLFKSLLYKKLVDILENSPEKNSGIEKFLRCLSDRFSKLVENWKDVPCCIIFNIRKPSPSSGKYKTVASYSVLSTFGSSYIEYPSLFPQNFSLEEYKKHIQKVPAPDTGFIDLHIHINR
jgi:hypothetical protein